MFAIKKLKLNNFRCYTSKLLEFSPNINILYGDNAVGKTSVVEAIAYFGMCKSFRGAKDRDLIKENQDYFFLKASFIAENELKDEIIVSFNGKDKKIKKNNYIYNKISDFFGYFNVISFEPSDLNLIKGGPIERRRFLDVNTSQYNKEYMVGLIRFNKILKKRNEFLKQTEELNANNLEYLKVIDEMYCKEAIKLIDLRTKFILELNNYVKSAALKISGGKESVILEYSPSENVENFVEKLCAKRKYDFLCKSTSVGPHRDDILIKINEKSADQYASQGQIRTAVIAMKLGLAEMLRKYNENQIILLDDVFSELDFSRQTLLLELLNRKNQIFITTTSISSINDDILNESELIKVTKETENE